MRFSSPSSGGLPELSHLFSLWFSHNGRRAVIFMWLAVMATISCGLIEPLWLFFPLLKVSFGS
jgi:hypothetical protein